MNLFIDLDDTLVGSSRAYDESMIDLGIRPDDKIYLQARAQIKQRFLDLNLGQPSVGEVAASHSRHLYFKRYLELMGRYSPEEHVKMNSAYENRLADKIQQQWLSLGRQKFFVELKKKFEKIFILTNETLRMQSLKIQKMDPNFNLFDGMLTSEEAGVGKPAARFFSLALEMFDCRPENTMMVGDSFKNDIEPTLQLKFCRSIQSLEFISAPQKKHSHTVQNLEEILNASIQ